jgi:DNA-binding winged helix-turn-helix (wHTH) protein
VTTHFRFAEFTFSPERQVLTRSGTTVRVGSRALAILHLLVERRESLVTRRDILARVWSGLEVGEENIRLNILALRRALNDDQVEQRFIVTDHGRGYRFVAPVTEGQREDSQAVTPATGPGGSHLPELIPLWTGLQNSTLRNYARRASC